LDTCNPHRYAEITRGGSLEATLGAIDAALHVGIPSVKINCVPMRGQDHEDLFALSALAKNKPISVRFIEVMPIGNGQCFETVPNDHIKQILESKLGVLKPVNTKLGNGPSEYWKPEGFLGHIGFISAVSHSFCDRCNRVRLTSNGFLKLCLNYESGIDLRKILRDGVDDTKLADIMKIAIANKPSGHKFSSKYWGEGEEHDYMSQIGG
jgi:cyclic pyranopterin phosphate synthase